jgi:hypothetical protein
MTNNGQTDTAVQDQQYPARCMSTLSARSRSVRHLGEQPLGLLLGQDADRGWRDLMQLGVGVHRFSC